MKSNIEKQIEENSKLLDSFIFSEYKDMFSKNKEKDISLRDFLNSCLYEGAISLDIQSIRNIKEKNERDIAKKKLRCVSISGQFENAHIDKGLLKHSNLIQLDFDNIEHIERTIDLLKLDQYIFCLLLSPSGTGIKGIVKINGSNHKESFIALEKYFSEKYQLKLDEKCKNVSRLFFYTYDPNLFINPKSKVFEQIQPISNSSPGLKQKSTIGAIHHPSTPSECWNFTQQKESYIEGNRDNFCFMYGNRCNEAGLSQNEALQYALGHCTGLSEIEVKKCIKSAYSNISNHGKHQNKELIQSIKSPKESSSPIITLKKEANKNQQSEKEILISNLYKRYNDNTGNLKGITLEYNGFVDLFLYLGYRRFDIGKEYIIVHILNNVLSETTAHNIQQNVFKFIESAPDMLPQDVPKMVLIEKLRKSRDKIFNKSFMTMLNPEKEYIFNTDTANEVFIYYQNGFVKVSANNVEFLEYKRLSGYIWKNQILNRNFKKLDDNTVGKFIFFNFLKNISNNDEERLLALQTLIGYLLHNYYEAKLKAVVFTDSSISDEPNGRTGKTLLGKALSQIKPTTIINAKTFIPDDKFRYQEVNYETQIVFLNDLKPHFDVETLFNDITEEIKIERKNQAPVFQNAKFLIATNRTLKIINASAKDRFIEFEFSEYYNEKFSPLIEFKKMFFGHDFTEKDWNEFDNVMCECISVYFEFGIKEAKPINLYKRKAIEETNTDFVNWFDNIISEGYIKNLSEYDKAVLHEKFFNDYPDYRLNKYLSLQKNFTKYIHSYCRNSENVNIENERQSSGNRYISFRITHIL